MQVTITITCLIIALLCQVSNVVHSANSTDSPDNQVCKSMQNPGDSTSKGILCIGQLTGDRLVVITKDWYVFLLPLQSLTDTIGKLYVNGSKPELMSKKWPNLDQDTRFKYVSEHIYNSFVWVSPNEKNYIFLTMKLKHTAVPYYPGVAYDIDRSKVFDAVNYEGDDDQVLIGKYKSFEYYAINKEAQQLHISTFHKTCEQPGCDINISSDWFRLCKVGDTQLKIEKDQNGECTQLDWPVMNGFVFKEQMYLFGKSYIVNFPEKVWTEKGQPVNMRRIDYGDFVQCDGTINVPFNPDGPSTVAPVKWGIIVAIVLVIVLLLLCCLLCLMREAFFGKKKKNHTSRSSGGSGRPGSSHHKGSSRLARSSRSRALIGGGNLTGKDKSKAPGTRGSVRSKDSHGPGGKMSQRMKQSHGRSLHGGSLHGASMRGGSLHHGNSRATGQGTNRSGLKATNVSAAKASATRAAHSRHTAVSKRGTDRSKLKNH